MTPADCHSLLSDEEPPMPWSYRYSTAEECLALKQEPEWDTGGESEAASWACLYADHDVKEEIVFGPEQLQPQDIAISMQHALIKTEDDPYLLKLPDKPRTECVSSPTLSGESQTDKTFEQLPYCFVRLERFILGQQCTSSSLTVKTFICNICQKKFAGQNYLTNHIKTHIGYFCHICMEKFEYPRFLTAHIELHKAKPYSCNVCKKMFTQSSELNAHMLEHTMPKYYHCNIYQKHFTLKKILYKHMRKRHPDHTKPKYNIHHHKHDKHMRHPKANEQLTHMQDHEKEKSHCCTICQKRFLYRKTLLTHMRVRHPKEIEQLAHTQDNEKEKTHCCTVCQRRFVYRKTLLTHMRVRHPKENEQLAQTKDNEKEKTHCCTVCQRRFVYRKTLLTHMRVRHPKENEQLAQTKDNEKEKTHCCTVCQRRFVYRKTLLTHMRVRHPKANDHLTNTQEHEKEKSHCCTICQRRFVYRKTLLTHMRVRHPKAKEHLTNKQEHEKEKPHCCTICQRRFVYSKTLLTHMRVRHPKENEQFSHTHDHEKEKLNEPIKQLPHNPDLTEGKPHCCDICQRRFVYRKTLMTHMRKHPKNKRNFQHTQPPRFAKQQARRLWQIKQSLEKAHSCDICHRRFVYRKTLLTHMRLRHKKVIIPNKQLAHNQDLTEEKPHCCDICHRRFLYRKTLLTHMRVRHPKENEQLAHTQDNEKEKPHCCTICQRRFVYRKTLLTHMRVRHPKAKEHLTNTQEHEKEKPHCCTICQRRFVYRKTLLTHMRVRHPKEKEQFSHTHDHKKEKLNEPIKQLTHNPDLTEGKPHCCDICQRRFVYRKTLMTHMRKHPKNKRNFQHTQPPRFAKQQARRLWKIKQSLEKAHSCDICHRRFVYRKTLLTHMRLRHKKVIIPNKQLAHNQDLTEEKPHCCDICHRRFLYRKTLMTHMRLQHQKMDEHNKELVHNQDLTEEKSHCCDICQRRFMHRKTLLYHIGRRHKIPKERNEQPAHETDLTKEKPHCCSVCRKRFVYRKSLITHMRKHPEGKLDTQVTPPSSLANQSQNLILEKSHCCKICPRQFVYRKTLLTHMRLRHPKATENLTHTQDHEKEKPHCCTICQRRFVYRKTLLTHMRVRHPKANDQLAHTQDHEKEKPNEPDKQLARNPDLSEGKPYCCDICHKRFRYRKTLTTHMRLRHQKMEPNNELTQNRDKHQKVDESINQQIPSPNSTKHEQDHGKEKLQCCDICQKRFVYRKSLMSHMRKHLENKSNFQHTQPPRFAKQQARRLWQIRQGLLQEKAHCCDICQRRFMYRKNLVTHMREQHQKVKELNKQNSQNQDLTKEKPHCCDVCQRRFMYRKTLLYHMRRRHKKPKERNKQLAHEPDLTKRKPHCCDICQRRFVYRKTLMTHMRKHPENKPKVQLTQLPRFAKQQARRHLQIKQDLIQEKAHCCDICQRRFVYRKTLMTHMRLRHQKVNEPNKQQSHNQDLSEEKPHCCDICQRRFMYRKTLLYHMSTRHKKPRERKEQLTHETDLTKEKPHCCDICQRRFLYRKTLMTHMRKHPENKPKGQPPRFAKQQARRHLRIKQDLIQEKAHCCDICHRRFVYRKTLLTHMRLRHEKVNKLDDQQITHAHGSIKHKEDHTKEKAHRCSVCRKRFVYKKTLITHMQLRHQKASKLNEEPTKHKRNLTEEKRHCCEICEKRFVYEKALLTHMRQHTGTTNKPLEPSISVSNVDFINKQTHTQQNLYTCDICEKQFAHKNTLDNHLRLHAAVKSVHKQNTLTIHTTGNTTERSDEVQKPYSCNLCREQFSDLNVLIDHALRWHAEEGPFRCNIQSVTK